MPGIEARPNGKLVVFVDACVLLVVVVLVVVVVAAVVVSVLGARITK